MTCRVLAAIVGLSPGVVLLALLGGVPNLRAQMGTGSPTASEQQARACLDKVSLAETTADLTALNNLFTDDFTYVHSTGAIESKAQFMDAVKTKRRQYHTIDLEDVQVRVRGDTAILTGRTNIKMAIGTRDVSLRLRFTTVCVAQGGKWQMAAWQSTPIAEAGGSTPPTSSPPPNAQSSQ